MLHVSTGYPFLGFRCNKLWYTPYFVLFPVWTQQADWIFEQPLLLCIINVFKSGKN